MTDDEWFYLSLLYYILKQNKDGSVSEGIPKLGHLIAKEQLREKEISPAYGKDEHVRLFSTSKPFYIIDREYLRHSFRGKVNVLDIDHTSFWLLELFFVWMSFQSRFHRNNLIVEPASLTPGSVNWQATPVMDPERVDGFFLTAAPLSNA